MEELQQKDTPFVDAKSEYGKRIDVKPAPKPEIGADVDNVFFENLVGAGLQSSLDISTLKNFTSVSQRRDQVYELIDTMTQDSTVAVALETFAEEATEYNDNQQIVWVTSDDDNVRHYIEYLLAKINVDKHIFDWTLNLCKYGDIYLRLYRQSDYNDDNLFDLNLTHFDKSRQKLREDVQIKAYSADDHYAHYVELMRNPAEYFELTRHGKTYGYIKAPVMSKTSNTDALGINIANQFRYSFNKQDVTIYDATQFVHASLYDNSSRTPEEVSIFTNSEGNEKAEEYTYTVKRGQSIFYNIFKIWRELSLLETAILLNRVTKSSVVRIIQVEIGTMDKNQIGPHLQGIKAMFEQKSAIDTGSGMSEYTNPGPMENNIYVPTRNNVGSITVQSVGGDNTNVTGLADLDYFKNKFYAALGIPKQYFNDTGDGGGFDAGKSLSIISSKFAKRIKRIQNAMIQALTDMINLMLIDAELDSYVNKFNIVMLAPTTQEELDRRENVREKVGIVTDIMNMLSDVNTETTKLKILKSLLSTSITDTEVINLIQDEIDNLEQKPDGEVDLGADTESSDEIDLGSDTGESSSEPSSAGSSDTSIDVDAALGLDSEESGPQAEESDIILPQPASLGQDFTEL